MPRVHARAALVLAGFAVAGCARSLASFEGEITMHSTDARGVAHDLVVETMGGKLRFDATGAGGKPVHAVFDPAQSRVVLYLDSEQAYFDLDFAKPGAAPSTDPQSSTATKSGGTKTIAGYECESWAVADATGKRSDVCIAHGIAFFDVSVLRTGGTGPESATARRFREDKSFPLESVDFDAAGRELSRTEVTKIEKKPIDDSRFDVPQGYRRVERPRAPR
jgi:Domain of unknown function (DUF4412)